MHIGVFGGAFDPPHSAHVTLAQTAQSQLHLDKLLWIPTFISPHKSPSTTSFSHRVEMVRTLLPSCCNSEVSPIERDLPHPSYTLHTLWALKNLYGSTPHWTLLLGGDSWLNFSHWFEPEKIRAEVTLAIYPRNTVLDPLPPGVVQLEGPLWKIESHTIRKTLATDFKQGLSLLPNSVANYIREHGLYQNPMLEKDSDGKQGKN